jgi:hypothetical protein
MPSVITATIKRDSDIFLRNLSILSAHNINDCGTAMCEFFEA